MPRNNSFRPKDAPPTPMPRDFEGGSSDFGVLRIVDGHDHYPVMDDLDGDGVLEPSYRNCNYPESSEEDGLY